MSMDEALAIHREAFFHGVYASGRSRNTRVGRNRLVFA